MNIRFSILSLLLLSVGISVLPPASANVWVAEIDRIANLDLKSGSAMLVDLRSHKIIYAINPDEVVPVASITKLMTAMVILDARQPLDEFISVDIRSTKELKGVYSRVRVNSEISRRDMLLLTLMSSENRAAASLAHHYPGGYDAFIDAMNAKAKSLGMHDTHYVEPTGLAANNVSTARDLTKLLIVTKQYPLISQLSTTAEKIATFRRPSYTLPFRNTNHLVHNGKWDIQVTKTGFTNPAGHCLTMRTVIGNRPVALVVLGAVGKYNHFADANRLRSWMEESQMASYSGRAKKYGKQKVLQPGLQSRLAQLSK